nr:immunoglobulin heavy chain junction region [Mus musculus]MBK4195871.1 immunoglobulin heavy chain junction region [Mus musculus]MBK4195874.1 immunoglobulin heavy chain junction region [Mus musculus]MBK4195876.1 immunoglobulin heavy chain junction region [Mus musculus]
CARGGSTAYGSSFYYAMDYW